MLPWPRRASTSSTVSEYRGRVALSGVAVVMFVQSVSTGSQHRERFRKSGGANAPGTTRPVCAPCGHVFLSWQPDLLCESSKKTSRPENRDGGAFDTSAVPPLLTAVETAHSANTG